MQWWLVRCWPLGWSTAGCKMKMTQVGHSATCIGGQQQQQLCVQHLHVVYDLPHGVGMLAEAAYPLPFVLMQG